VRSYIIIEKNSATIQRINEVFNDFADLSCLGIADTYESAMNLILKESPSLVFFNIDSVIPNIFQFINEINQYKEHTPELIAISAAVENAFLAIKNGCLDAILQPLAELDIRKAILKYEKKNKQSAKKTICLKSYGDYQYLNTNDILFLKADNNTTDFYMKDGNVITAFKTLKIYGNLLPTNFLRIHKSYIINSSYVSRVNFSKSQCTIDRNITKIPFTKTYLDNVKLMNALLSNTSLLTLN